MKFKKKQLIPAKLQKSINNLVSFLHKKNADLAQLVIVYKAIIQNLAEGIEEQKKVGDLTSRMSPGIVEMNNQYKSFKLFERQVYLKGEHKDKIILDQIQEHNDHKKIRKEEQQQK
uniref:Uncharacterized protein n=1 Tax=Euplotes harpa TaxID=151035 RepID=A0A7S3N6Y5_9SPIT|mmetsp:Transcript_13069/g.15080  ORF Transcript_13069/g.15080 Transcript_13069/m.15080 type:complete len:116 (+) Transcript_13069:1045-1392(+)